MTSGSKPRPAKVEESSGALLGRAFNRGAGATLGCSTFGFEVNSEEIICVGGRGVGAARSAGTSACCVASFRGFLLGRSAMSAERLETGTSSALRFATRFAFTLQYCECDIVYRIEYSTYRSVHLPPFFALPPFCVDGPSSSSRLRTRSSSMFEGSAGPGQDFRKWVVSPKGNSLIR